MKHMNFQHPPGPDYHRPFGFMQNKAIRKEISTLDPKKDCQRIVYLMVGYEFTQEIINALDIVYLGSGGNNHMADILGRSHYLTDGLKRYKDSRFLILKFLESGWDQQEGADAIRHINKLHSKYRIDNAQFVQALCVFLVAPIEWINNFGWRKLTTTEKDAWYHFWINIGTHMNIHDMPKSISHAGSILKNYYRNITAPSKYAKALGDSTMAVYVEKSPWYFKPFARTYYRSFFTDFLREAYQVDDLPSTVKYSVYAGIKAHATLRRYVSPSPFPYVIGRQSLSSYGIPQPTTQPTTPASTLDLVDKSTEPST